MEEDFSRFMIGLSKYFDLILGNAIIFNTKYYRAVFGVILVFVTVGLNMVLFQFMEF
jgi:hypothetical protein